MTDRASALNEVKRYWRKEIVQNFGDDTDHCLPIMLIAAKADLAKSTFDEQKFVKKRDALDRKLGLYGPTIIHSQDFLALLVFCAMLTSLNTTDKRNKVFPVTSGERPVNVECTMLLSHSLKVEFQGNTRNDRCAQLSPSHKCNETNALFGAKCYNIFIRTIIRLWRPLIKIALYTFYISVAWLHNC